MDVWTSKIQSLSDDMLLLIRHALRLPRTYYVARTDDTRFQILNLINDDGCRLDPDTNIPIDDSFCGILYRTRQDVLVIEDVRTDERVATKDVSQADVGSYLGVRIELSDGESFGTLCALDPNPQGFDASQIACMQSAARILSNAISSEFLAYRDALSGLFNRTYLYEVIKRQTMDKVTFILFDLDDFKSVNDEFGHEAGDALIRAFGALLQEVFPQQEHIRLGGDEFCVILPQTKDDEVASRVEQLRAALSQLSIHKTTLSCGVSRGDLNELSQLLASADKALYQAKFAGKNCIVFI